VVIQHEMLFHSIFSFTFIVLIILKITKSDIPGCHFWETVNVSNSQRLQNGSYLYQDFVVPANLIGEYNYTRTQLGHYNETESHLRGCVCHLKPCIWICCRFIDWDASNGKCTDGMIEELSEINPYLKVTLSNGSIVKRNLLKDFTVLRDQLESFDFWKEDNYTMFEVGFLISVFVSLTNLNTLERKFIAEKPCRTYSYRFRKIAVLWLSEVFLILTIAVYLYVKKLRNLHGKCFICYMVSSCIFFIYDLLEPVEKPLQLCPLYAYSYYLITMAKFTWLLSLSHQMWKGFTSLNRAESQHSFRAYSIFVWGTAALLTGVLFLVDYIFGGMPNNVNWIPGVGWQNCDLKYDVMHIYIRGPMSTLIALNTVLFIWTIVSIIRVKLSLKHFSDSGDVTRNFNSRMQTYTMYIRLFIAMDIQWSVRIISFFCDWHYIFQICEYCDYGMGTIIFVLFILKPSTIRLL
ncbi:hypothetical protein KR032_003279, partial [Drosophila birchii]